MSILLVLSATFLGSVAAILVVNRLPRHRVKTGVITAAVLLAALAAAATNATQFLLDLGLPFTTVDVMEAGSYFVFGFSVTAAWVWLKPSRLRWFLLALVPVALFEPLRWAFVFIVWSSKRFVL